MSEGGAELEHGRLHVGKRFWFLALPCQATGLVIHVWLVIGNVGAAIHDGRLVAIDAADKLFIASADYAIKAASIRGDMDAAAPPPSVPEELPVRDWSLLPLDVLASVFVRLSAVDVLRGAGLVCRSWLQAAKVPDVWRVVDMGYHNIMFKYDKKERADLCAMAKAAVDRSDGQLREFAGRSFVTDELMQYIVERSPSLTTLRLVCCWKVHCWKVFSARLAGVVTELPLNKLQSLELDYIDLLVGELVAILENCPNLDVLTVRDCSGLDEEDEPVLREKFARIKNLIYDCVGECFDDCWYDYGD
ncbi:hypothetical protein QYE76_060870 [Lolium multiflorum]|uniref:F-box domain-containing protein n=1 Tax=Lolium multiflorum TaxID=4521 RepID=A0AAD8S257_LOLMU|nr:hypothetical protein QYE76_060870 [Lolium multiflorum]